MFQRMSRRLGSTTSSSSSCSSASSSKSCSRSPSTDSSRCERQIVRVVLLGGSGVGKTSIIRRFLFNDYPMKHEPTLEMLHRADFEIGQNIFTIDLLDTSGTYEFTGMRNLAIDSGDAFVLVYSVDNEESFNEVERLRNEILERRIDVPIVIVGNKADKDSVRQVRTETIEPLVNIEWDHGYVETSAKDDANVIKIFTELMDRSDHQVLLSPAARRRRDSFNQCSSLTNKKSSTRRMIRRASVISPKLDSQMDSTTVSCCVM